MSEVITGTTSRGTALEIHRVENGWVVRDLMGFRSDPLQARGLAGTHVFRSISEMVTELPGLLEEAPKAIVPRSLAHAAPCICPICRTEPGGNAS